VSGWIKLHRDLIKWEWYETPNMVQFFVHCLLRANHTPKRWQGIDIDAGQFVSGRVKLSQETGLSQQSVRTCIERLKSTNELTIKSTSKYSVFTLNNWEKYQSGETATSNLTNGQPASNQQVTTNKNEKNEKNIIKKHFFENSPYFDKAKFKERFPDWSTDKLKHYWESAKDYSDAHGKKYKDWISAIRGWDRKDPYQEKGLSV